MSEAPLPHELVRFAHNSERQFAKLLDFYGIEWTYEPRTFTLERDRDGHLRVAPCVHHEKGNRSLSEEPPARREPYGQNRHQTNGHHKSLQVASGCALVSRHRVDLLRSCPSLVARNPA